MLTVSICSITNRFNDEACPLARHEHTSLTHASFIAHRHASIVQTADLKRELKRNELIPLDDVNAQVFPRIIKGIGRSVHVEPRIRKYYADRIAIAGGGVAVEVAGAVQGGETGVATPPARVSQAA